jgi:hypothetical protein
MEYEGPIVDLGCLENYIMSCTSGNEDDVVDHIIERSGLNFPSYVERHLKKRAREITRGILNALADEGKLRLNDREITGDDLPYKLVFVTTE